MLVITRRFDFDAAHRVLGHEGKCRHLHGHRYVAEVTVRAPELDKLSRIIDFSVLKERIGTWIDLHWDHNILLNEKDPLLRYAGDAEVWGSRLPYIMHSQHNPTAESMAQDLFGTATLLMLDTPITVTAVRLYETPNCWADYTPPEHAC